MTERTVTVQTEQEETITLCDHCGLSDDAGEIVTYKVSKADSSGVENVRDYEALHLHTSCLNEIGIDVPEMGTFAKSVDENIPFMNTTLVALDGFGIAMVGIIALGALAAGMYGFNGLGISGIGLMGLGSLMGLIRGWDAANQTIEELQ